MALKKHVYAFDNPKGRIEFEYLEVVNYVLTINNVPMFERFVLANESDRKWSNVTVELSGKMIRESVTRLDSVAPKSSLDLLSKVGITVNAEKLAELTEGADSLFSIKVTIDGVTVFDREFPLFFQAYDQWIGSLVRPDLLASFVTPNHPRIAAVIGNARAALKRMTDSDSFDAYQTGDVNNVRCQVAAIYEALRAEGLSYVLPPAGFESSGQRLRLADKVLDEKLGTCIDLSLLYASCLEAIGLNPLLILTRDHCFVGCWLVRDCYLHTVGDDADFLLKAMSNGISEIVAMEATCLTGSDNISFERACAKAVQNLNAESEFECFIDVCQARINHICPIPLRVRRDDGSWQIINDGVEHDASADKVKVLDRYDLSAYDADSSEVTKYTIWERKLLDFSLRNTLLNIRSGRRVIPLLSFAIDRLEDSLQNGESFSVRPFPLNETPVPGERGIFESTNYGSVEEHVIDEMKQRRLYSFLDDAALTNSLKYVYRASRTSMEENGANNLYMVLGLLKWYETEQSSDPHFAPLLLLPIEIVRTLRGGGYTIRARDEEVSLNITLTELLRQQHDIDLSPLNELPKDEYGVDVKRILAFVRERIRYKRGWNVLDESLIGIFSFNKFVMWNDIHSNSEKLHQNEVISSLVEGKLNVSGAELAPVDVRAADHDKKPSDYAIPIDVDSSQLEAIIASGEGKSFILHGPPGTGKSQTITNIIANALYQGKRVLFVAEKMAALVVVQERLSKIGLAPFCLELHSNKATKQHFLHQMDEALNVARGTDAPDYEATAGKVFEKRREILKYVEAMHRKDNSGFSLYDCIEHYFSVADCENPVNFSVQDIADFTPEKIAEAIEALRRMAPVLAIIGKPGEHPLRDLRVNGNWSEAERLIRTHLPDTAKWTATFAELNDSFRRIWGADVPDFSRGDDELEAFKALLGVPELSGNLIRLLLHRDRIPALRQAVAAGEEARNIRDAVAAKYADAYLALDTASLRRDWNDVESKWFIPRYFARKKFMRQLPATNTALAFADVPSLLDEIARSESSNAVFADSGDELASIFGTAAGPEPRWQAMDRSLELIQAAAAAMEAPNNPALFTADNIVKFAAVVDNSDRPALDKAAALNERLIAANKQIRSHFREFSGCLAECGGDPVEMIGRWDRNIPMLKDWVLFCRLHCEFAEIAGKDCMEQLSHPDPVNFTVAALQKGFYRAKGEQMIAADEALTFFNGAVFDDTVRRYTELTRELQELSKQALYHRLASNLPSQSMLAIDTSELGILKRNIKSGGRGKSIRSIIDMIPTLLPKLSPCMLMSPISVAQYISLETPKFDIVIFDEASQMPTSEAVGAIARGKSLIVVGDPKQMPPTSFFSTSAVGEDEAHIDDMESILDDCIAMSIPSKYLSWHYRSKHESLITFSNRQYYDGRLTTFPSVDNLSSKVTLRHIDGVYDRSRSRCNSKEAEAVVAEVLRRLADPELSRRSIGIVAFSKVQQDKIEDMLNANLAERPELEELAFNCPEPVFVKNLENVQGDERDVILFSVGYGPDKTGKVSMNFGPLNIAGGERRLNVAVSRARYEMVVFSSLRPEQIDLRRTNALGVAGLKHFLEYAAGGRMTDIPAGTGGDDSAADNVLGRLRQLVEATGYDFDMRVGNSNFRVDVAIKDPEEPEKYILGLLLDGPSYYATQTTRDREIVQPAVLRLLNWNVMKVWTLDLLERPDSVSKTLAAKIEECLEAKHRAPAVQAAPAAPETAQPAVAAPAEVPAAVNTRCVDYPPVDIDLIAKTDNVDQLKTRPAKLKKFLAEVIRNEAPITGTLLCKRVVKAFGLGRVSPKVQEVVNFALARMGVYGLPDGEKGTVYWERKADAEGYDKYRTGSGRDIADVPRIEVENAMLYVLEQQVALSVDDLKRLTGYQLGYVRLGTNITAVTTQVLADLENRGLIKITDGKASQP